ncbi:tyrosine-type recombinase/integrase [Litorivivens sp.]|uniref:tyrosine-type recombinase/integrase n=1 Tax=Litorivivens sp. TaxID=2020868 RepID=UPI003565EBE3
MGRPRKKDRHLPPYMYQKGASYYFCRGADYVNLGASLREALVAYVAAAGIDRNIVTINDLIDDFLVELEAKQHPDYRGLSSHTVKDYKKHFNRFRLVFGPMRPGDLKRTDVYGYRDKRRDAPVQANRELSSLLKLMEHAVLKGLIEENPVRNVRRYPESPRNRLPSQGDLDAVMGVGDKKIAGYVRLKNLIGLRQGDMLALRWANQLDEGLLAYISKAQKWVIFGWNADLRAALQELRDIQNEESTTSEFIICNKWGRKYSQDGFRSRWSRARKKALESGKLAETFTEHDIRAKVATDISSALGLEEASKVLVHASLKTTGRYVRDIPVLEINGSLKSPNDLEEF